MSEAHMNVTVDFSLLTANLMGAVEKNQTSNAKVNATQSRKQE